MTGFGKIVLKQDRGEELAPFVSGVLLNFFSLLAGLAVIGLTLYFWPFISSNFQFPAILLAFLVVVAGLALVLFSLRRRTAYVYWYERGVEFYTFSGFNPGSWSSGGLARVSFKDVKSVKFVFHPESSGGLKGSITIEEAVARHSIPLASLSSSQKLLAELQAGFLGRQLKASGLSVVSRRGKNRVLVLLFSNPQKG